MTFTTKDITPRKIQLFWEKVNKNGDCWLWTAAKVRRGYGYFAVVGSRCATAHRVSYLIANGNIPAGKLVLHKCDNPTCVRPAHLFLGTFADNSADMVRKGRQARGINNGGGVKLTDKAVREIRILHKMDFSHATLAKLYGVNRETIKRVLAKKNWSHVK